MTKYTLAVVTTLISLSIVGIPAVMAEVPEHNDYLPAWTQVVSGCTVDESSTSLVSLNNSVVAFATGKTGSITLRCNVTNPLDQGNPGWNAMIVQYRDPDGLAANTRVIARLLRVERSTGGAGTVATFDSNAFPATTLVERLVHFPALEVLDFKGHSYVVVVTLNRTVTTSTPLICTLRLCLVTDIPADME